MASLQQRNGAIPARAGIGLRGPHMAEILSDRPALSWVEVHPENYLRNHPARAALHQVRRDVPVSLHGVALSLGSYDGLDRGHLRELRFLADEIGAGLVSEHLAWSRVGGIYVNDLLPLPYTDETLAIVCRNVDQAQEALGRRILVENPSSYLGFNHSCIAEPEFLAEIAARTGCGLLCDVNNIFVTAENFGLDPVGYIDALPAAAIGEVHLSGHFRTSREGQKLLIDDHGDRVCPEVWALFRHALGRFGSVPVMIEWDKSLPPLAVLQDEAARAETIAGEVVRESCFDIAC